MKNTKRIFRFLAAALASVVLLASCNVNKASRQMQLAEKQTQLYYKYMKKYQIDSAMSLFDPTFYEVENRDTVRSFYEMIRARFGPLESIEELSREYSDQIIKGRREKTVSVVYLARYQSGYKSKEEFLFFTNEQPFELIDNYSFKTFNENEVEDE